jgi:hypothetical protein
MEWGECRRGRSGLGGRGNERHSNRIIRGHFDKTVYSASRASTRAHLRRRLLFLGNYKEDASTNLELLMPMTRMMQMSRALSTLRASASPLIPRIRAIDLAVPKTMWSFLYFRLNFHTPHRDFPAAIFFFYDCPTLIRQYAQLRSSYSFYLWLAKGESSLEIEVMQPSSKHILES